MGRRHNAGGDGTQETRQLPGHGGDPVGGEETGPSAGAEAAAAPLPGAPELVSQTLTREPEDLGLAEEIEGDIGDGAGADWAEGELPVRDAGRYTIEGEHGRGGLGRVLLARDRELGRTIALKEMRLDGASHEKRFLREARITARLEHPGIVPVYEAGRWPGGKPFYAMKLVQGRVLTGRRPYEGASPQDMVARVQREAPAPVETLEPKIPAELAAIVAKAMARAPGDRYPSAAEFGHDLRRYQTGKLVYAHRYTWRQHAFRTSRHRGPAQQPRRASIPPGEVSRGAEHLIRTLARNR